MKIGCCTSMDNYNDLCEIGYDFIELSAHDIANMSDEQFSENVKIIKNHDISVLGFNNYCDGEPAIVGPNYDSEKTRDYAKLICKRGSLIGIKNIGIGAPKARKIPHGFDSNLAYNQGIECISIICDEANKYGIDILFEGLNIEMSDFIITTHDALKFIKKVNRNNLWLVLDYHHMIVMKEDLNDTKYVVPFVKHIHLNHIAENSEREYLIEENIKWFTEPIKFIKKFGYNRTVSIEAETNNFKVDAKRSYDILKRIIGD